MKLPVLASALLIAALPSAVFCFYDTTPFLAYHVTSPSLGEARAKGSKLFDQLSIVSRRDARGPALYSRDLAKALVRDQRSLCQLDGVALVEIRDLDSHAFSSLPASNPLKARIASAQSKFGLQHIFERTGSTARELARAIQSSCGGSAISLGSLVRLGKREDTWVVREDLGAAKGEKKTFVRTSANFSELQDGSIASALAQFESTHPNHLVLLIAREEPLGVPSLLNKRASPSGASKASPEKDGIFHKYQLFSTAILLCALVTLLLIVPVVWLTVGLLGGIATPDRLGEKSRLTEMSKKAT